MDGTDLTFEVPSQCSLRRGLQVMEEGEKLSKKQVELEGIIKRLRQQLGGLEGERDKLAGRLAAEEGAVAELKKAKAKLEKDLALAGGSQAAQRTVPGATVRQPPEARADALPPGVMRALLRLFLSEVMADHTFLTNVLPRRASQGGPGVPARAL